MRIILLNGPRRSGKDTLAREFSRHVPHPCEIVPMFHPAKIDALAEFDLPASMVAELEADEFKDRIHTKLEMKTPRQVYIDYGNRTRREKGHEYFANRWMRYMTESVDHNEVDYVLVPDVRFALEMKAATNLVGCKQVLLVHVHKEGCSWRNDIGTYINDPDAYQMLNNGPLDATGASMEALVETWRLESK